MNNQRDNEYSEEEFSIESSGDGEEVDAQHHSDDSMDSYEDYDEDEVVDRRPNIRERIKLSKESIEAMKDEAKKKISCKYYVTVDMLKKNMNDEFFNACFDPINMLTRSTTFLPLRSEVKALPKYSDGEIKSNVSPTLLLMIVKFLFFLLFGPTYSIPLFGQVSNTWAYNMMLLFESYFSASEIHAAKLESFSKLFGYCFDVKNRSEEASLLYDQILGDIDIRTPLFEIDFSDFLTAYSKIRAIEVRTEKALCAKQDYLTKICDILDAMRTHAAIVWEAHGYFETTNDEQREFFLELFGYEIDDQQARLMHNTSSWRYSELFPINIGGDLLGSYKTSPAMLVVNRKRLNRNGFFSNGQQQNKTLLGNGFLQAEMNGELPMTSCKLKYVLKAKLAKEAVFNIQNAREGFRSVLTNEMEAWMPDQYLNKPERMHGLGVPCNLDYEPDIVAEMNLCADIRSAQREQIQNSVNRTRLTQEALPEGWLNRDMIEERVEYRRNRPIPTPPCGLPPIQIRHSIAQKGSLETRLAIDVCIACTDIFNNSVVYDHLADEDKTICMASRNQLVNLMRVMKDGIEEPLASVIRAIEAIQTPHRGIRLLNIWNLLRREVSASMRLGAQRILVDAPDIDELMRMVNELCDGLAADADPEYAADLVEAMRLNLAGVEAEVEQIEQRRILDILEGQSKRRLHRRIRGGLDHHQRRRENAGQAPGCMRRIHRADDQLPRRDG